MTQIAEIASSIASGQTRSSDVVRRSLDAIDAANPRLNAFVSLNADEAIRAAASADADSAADGACGCLAGVPIAVKDNICVAGGVTTCGSRLLECFRSTYDATVVRKLREAGAVIVGKTNLDEFAMGSSTETGFRGPARNPHDGSRVCGGSSGGSAAAVAAGLVPAALGSSTGGSIRQPAAMCGVVGLKPSYGRVSRYGLVAYASSLDQIGPIATSVADAALMLGVIAGHDPLDSTSVDAPVPDYVSTLRDSIEGLRIGVPESHFGAGLSPQIAAAVRAAIQKLADAGATIVPVDVPDVDHAVAAYYVIATAEASSNLARFDGMRYGRRGDGGGDLHETYRQARARGLGSEVKRRIVVGTYVLSAGYYDAYYLTAQKVRTKIRRDYDRVFEQVDLLAGPVTPTTAFRICEKADDPLAMYLEDVYTVSANLAGLCAISFPCGRDGGGLPIGVQLTGPPMGEARLLAAAWNVECRTSNVE